jgi:hypothetical protein
VVSCYHFAAMLTDQQLTLAEAKLNDLGGDLVLELDPGPDPDDIFAKALIEVVERLVALQPDKLKLVQVAKGRTYPSVTVRNIRYQAVPLDHELVPFLDLLVLLSRSPTPDEPVAPEIAVEILIAPTCPNCPLVVGACGEVASERPEIELVIIDVQYFTDLAKSARSVPTVIIDGTHTVVGMISADELRGLLSSREDPDYLVKTLASMIDNGRAEEAAPLLIDEQGHASLASLLSQGTMQQRMGLMLAVESALDRDPHGLDGAVPHLLPLLETEDATVRGDTADLLGQIGAPGARQALEQLLSDENPDVREVAAESLEMLRDPS